MRALLRRLSLATAATLLLALAIPAALLYFLAFTESGLQFVVAQIPERIGKIERVRIEGAQGTLAGGFLTNAWLGKPAPAEGTLTNRGMIKYKLIIDDFGGWDLFQELLRTMDGVAVRHGVNVAAVAGRWMLDRPAVAGIIVGARYADHLADDLKIFDFRLEGTDVAAIEQVLAKRQGPLGDTFELERDRDGRHGRIMKYNLNAA